MAAIGSVAGFTQMNAKAILTAAEDILETRFDALHGAMVGLDTSRAGVARLMNADFGRLTRTDAHNHLEYVAGQVGEDLATAQRLAADGLDPVMTAIANGRKLAAEGKYGASAEQFRVAHEAMVEPLATTMLQRGERMADVHPYFDDVNRTAEFPLKVDDIIPHFG